MEIKHDVDHDRFLLWNEDKQEVGTIVYRMGDNGDITATHTEVYEAFGGKGYASVLLNALVEYARAKKAKIIPICPYVKAAFTKHPEKYADVMK